jgi:hypothetical protein
MESSSAFNFACVQQTEAKQHGGLWEGGRGWQRVAVRERDETVCGCHAVNIVPGESFAVTAPYPRPHDILTLLEALLCPEAMHHCNTYMYITLPRGSYQCFRNGLSSSGLTLCVSSILYPNNIFEKGSSNNVSITKVVSVFKSLSTYGGVDGCIDPHFLDLGARWR